MHEVDDMVEPIEDRWVAYRVAVGISFVAAGEEEVMVLMANLFTSPQDTSWCQARHL